jgi:predicted dehydrogenase
MSSPVRICMIGAGRVGKAHTKSLLTYVPDGRPVAVVDPVAETRQDLGEQFDIEARFESLEAALDSVAFDAVIITTPTFTHTSLAVTAAEAGKHVFLEKPMAITLAECDEIIAAVERNNVFLQLAFMRRFAPEFVAAAERLEAGEIGQPMMIKSLSHGPGLPPPWARDLALSNGLLAEVNSHDWDCVRWLMGSNYQRVYTEVANFKGAARGVDTPNFYDNALVNIRFESGGLGNISGVCPCDYGYDGRVEIIGERGIMKIGDNQSEAIVVCTNRDQGLITPIYRTWSERFAWGYVGELQHFVQCIQTGTPPRVGGEDGRWAVAGALAGNKSWLEERPVYLSEVLQEAG